MNPYERATAVEAAGPGRFRGWVDTDWSIANGPNGGYLTGLLLRAAMAEQGAEARCPRSMTVHFLRPPIEGAAEIEVVAERTGRTFSTQTLRLIQEDKLRLFAVLASSDRRDVVEFSHRNMPEAPPAGSLPTIPVVEGDPPLRKHFDRRNVFGTGSFDGEERALSGGYIRLSEEPRGIDPPLLATFCDTWPPAIYSWAEADTPIGRVPTVDLTVHFRRDPRGLDLADDAFALVRFEVHTSVEGYLVETGEVWSENGLLLAESRQLAVVG